jgi:hypothetical protein
MVTSRAVADSPAISSFGSQVSAIAIITRWRSPQERQQPHQSASDVAIAAADAL